MAFILPNFTKLIITQEKFVDIYCKELYPNRTKTVENRDQISFTSFGKECFSLYRLSLSHNYSVILSRYLMHSDSSNSVERRCRHAQNLIYALQLNVSFTAP